MVMTADGGGYNAAAASEASRRAAEETARRTAEETRKAAEGARRVPDEAARPVAEGAAREPAAEAAKSAPALTKGTGDLAKAAASLRLTDAPLPWEASAPAEAPPGGAPLKGKLRISLEELAASQAAGHYACAAERANEAFLHKAPEQFQALKEDLAAGKAVNVNGYRVEVSALNRRAIDANESLDDRGRQKAYADTAMMEYAAGTSGGTYDYASGETWVPGHAPMKGLSPEMMKRLDDFGFTKTFDAGA